MASPRPCPPTWPRGGWEAQLRSRHSLWIVPGGNKDVTGVENPCGIGIPGEAGELWALGAAQPWGDGSRICVGVGVKIPGCTGGKGRGWSLFPDCFSGSPCSAPALQRAPGGVWVLLTEAIPWSPGDCWGKLPSSAYSVMNFCHTGGQAEGGTQKCFLRVHRRPLSCHPGSQEEFWTKASPAACVEDPRASLELTLPHPLHGP